VIPAGGAQVIKRNVQAVLVNGVTMVQVRLCVHGHNGSGFAAVPLCPFVFGGALVVALCGPTGVAGGVWSESISHAIPPRLFQMLNSQR